MEFSLVIPATAGVRPKPKPKPKPKPAGVAHPTSTVQKVSDGAGTPLRMQMDADDQATPRVSEPQDVGRPMAAEAGGHGPLYVT